MAAHPHGQARIDARSPIEAARRTIHARSGGERGGGGLEHQLAQEMESAVRAAIPQPTKEIIATARSSHDAKWTHCHIVTMTHALT